MIRILLDRAFDNEHHYIHAVGLSTDTKPTTGIITGSKFVAVDTGAGYLFDETAGEWNENPQFSEAVAAYLDEHPEALDQAAIEAMFGDQLDAIEAEQGVLKSAIDQVTGNMKLGAAGKNLCDITGMSVGYTAVDGTVNTGATSFVFSWKIPVSEGDVIRTYKLVNNTLSLVTMTYITAYNSSKTVESAKGSSAKTTFTVPSGVAYVVVSTLAADEFMITANYEATTFEPYIKPDYIAKEEFISDALAGLLDDTLSQENKPANAKAVGDALVDLSAALSENSGTEIKASKLGNWEYVRRNETTAKIQIDNSNIQKPIANAVSAKIISIPGTANGTIPTGFIAQSPNLLSPKIVCNGGYNKSVNTAFDLTVASGNKMTDNGDGTFTMFQKAAYTSGLLLTDKLVPGKTYDIHFASDNNSGLAINLYALNASYTVTRKFEYLSSAIARNARIKLDTGECYLAFGVGASSAGTNVHVLYPAVVVSSVEASDTSYTVLSNGSHKNDYVPYNTHILTFDTDAIAAKFPGFGQINSTLVNTLFVADKKAVQYGYYSNGSWVSDIKAIDLSDVITDAKVELSSNGTLTILYDGSDVPTATIEYTLTISEPYTGYAWCGLGDSLTAGYPNGTWGFYREYAKALMGLAKYADCGVGTSLLSGIDTYRPMWTDERVETLDLGADVVTVMGGTNDWGQLSAETTPIAGKMTGFGDADISNDDCTTFIGAYNVLISKIMYKYMLSDGYYQSVDYSGLTRVETAKPWFRLVLIAPPPRLDSDNNREALDKIAECVVKVGRLWGLPVVNAHDNLNVNEINKDSFFTVDYVHPDEEVHMRLAHLIVAKARELT